MATTVRFTARRSKAQVVAPARPTPRETKALSDMDDCTYLRHYIGAILFFRPVRREPAATDPAEAIRAALAEALVHYYPLAGRLREMPGGRLAVECTAQGAVFVDADADVRLEDFGQPALPPYPCIEELVCDVDDYTPVLGNPLIYMQLTRLRCGGFVLSVHTCHNVADGFGLLQFVKAIADLARGESRPAVLPVWNRESMFKARTPGRVRQDIFPGHASGIVTADTLPAPPADMVTQYFRFGPEEVAALRSHLPDRLARSCTVFELLSAFLWRCRTVALGYEPGLPVRLVFRMNARGKYPPIPRGYYGNCVLRPMVEAGVDDLCGRPLGHALELVQRAKLSTTEEHVRSTVDMITALRAHRHLDVDRAFHVVDTTRLGDEKIDMGWATAVGGGVPYITDPMSYHMALKNGDGEVITAVSMFLPKPAMERLEKEISMWIRDDAKKLIPSSM
ncbi:acyl transferase 1-like [Lolium rigidum]|uniref:acyl transferase 1-like n=1 Tax=Lolium rigidum TaxID=89674 RepID=UPI001F5C5583|nr:acyl transferase 1-like [Lolium rigidum]